MTIDLNTWIISDTHFGHKNIVKYCNRPMSHNEIMRREWLANVAARDTVLHLGDLAVWYGPEKDEWHRRAAILPGKKFMLRGNHDKLKDEGYADLGYTVIPEFIQEFDGKRVLFSHAPAGHSRARYQSEPWDINVHGHIHNNTHHDGDVDLFKGRKYINVSVEVMDYKPVRLGEVLA